MVKQERRHKYRDLELEERRYSIAVVYPDMVSGVSILEYLKLMVKRLTKMQHNLTYVVDCSPNSDLCQINRYLAHSMPLAKGYKPKVLVTFLILLTPYF